MMCFDRNIQGDLRQLFKFSTIFKFKKRIVFAGTMRGNTVIYFVSIHEKKNNEKIILYKSSFSY